jgi:hypothetical protein
MNAGPVMDPSRWLNVGSRLAFMPFVWWEMYWASWQTIMHRLGMLSAMGPLPTVAEQRETQRMAREKMQAGTETLRALSIPDMTLPLAMGRQWWKTMQVGFDVMGRLLRESQRYQPLFWRWSLMFNENMVDTMEMAVRPWHQRVTANAHRLGKRRANR